MSLYSYVTNCCQYCKSMNHFDLELGKWVCDQCGKILQDFEAYDHEDNPDDVGTLYAVEYYDDYYNTVLHDFVVANSPDDIYEAYCGHEYISDFRVFPLTIQRFHFSIEFSFSYTHVIDEPFKGLVLKRRKPGFGEVPY